MLWSKFLIPTAKETPADAVVPSHQLAIRAGLIRQVAAGSYTYLPLGYRTLRKIEAIVREEMDAAGAIELHMPAMQPLSLWEQSGRAEIMGDVLLRIKGNAWQASVALGPTHEEVITDTAKAFLNSYKQLPVNLYQIQTKFRGEERPKSGVLRTREFLMKDAYSFDADLAGLDASYERMYAAYCRIFARCGLPYLVVEAESGPIGGDASHEFMVLTDAGEDIVAVAGDGSYAANIERAARLSPPPCVEPPAAQMDGLRQVHTPGCASIDDVCAFLKIAPAQMIKTMVYTLPSEGQQPPRYVIACVRGDHDVNENKLRRAVKETGLQLAEPAAAAHHGFAIGYVGPHVVNQSACTLVIDPDARAATNAVTGANQADHHVTGFNWSRELPATLLDQATICDIRNVVEGDTAPNAGGALLSFRKAIEIGHVFKLGTKYSHALAANFLDENGKAQPFVMGCYGIGLNRILASAIEAHHDANGIIWPITIAPFEVLIVAVDVREPAVMNEARRIYDELTTAGVEVLLDDRDARPGFKFKDADLIGIPIRVTVGKKTLADGQVELKLRAGGEMEKHATTAIVSKVLDLTANEKAKLSR